MDAVSIAQGNLPAPGILPETGFVSYILCFTVFNKRGMKCAYTLEFHPTGLAKPHPSDFIFCPSSYYLLSATHFKILEKQMVKPVATLIFEIYM